VLYGGKVLEDTRVAEFFRGPQHPYSAALLAATPKYTDPEGSLTPVGEEVLTAVRAEVAEADREWRHV
jgi:peptide/nickel transport system ATP-binding protein